MEAAGDEKLDMFFTCNDERHRRGRYIKPVYEWLCRTPSNDILVDEKLIPCQQALSYHRQINYIAFTMRFRITQTTVTHKISLANASL